MIGQAVSKTIREWDHLPIGENGVAPGVAARLHALAERETQRLRVPQPILTRTAQPSLRAGQVVGVLAIPGASVEILPKIDGEGDGAVRHALTRMLGVVWNLRIAENEPASIATQRETLLEIIIRLFTDRLLVAVRRGLPHRYRLREDDLPVLRGKLNVHRQLVRLTVRSDRLACQYDELSVDTPLNRVLKAAVKRLMAASLSAPNQRRLGELAARFEFVGDSPNPMRERVSLDRTNSAFHRLHDLARLCLAGDWQSTMIGKRAGFGLLFPMNDLFEEFVGRSMKAALAPGVVHLQHTGHYALASRERRLFALRPDIAVDGNIVIDTKWKMLKPDEPGYGVNQSDVYQMLAYARAYDARRVVLLYPWHAGLEPAGVCRRWRVDGTSTIFDIATVDVGEPDRVPEVLMDIVNTPGSILGSP
ncbi:McrC family protein [Candidatus Rariloculus sp.]|uniref:McrC family protein n=1 Tax=Candidatus Rariloculus sp. TaxID=3101265 RepID=UPI003D0E7AC4